MTAPYKKKLIEVAIPLEVINAASARGKLIRYQQPSTLQKPQTLNTCETSFEQNTTQFNIERLLKPAGFPV